MMLMRGNVKYENQQICKNTQQISLQLCLLSFKDFQPRRMKSKWRMPPCFAAIFLQRFPNVFRVLCCFSFLFPFFFSITSVNEICYDVCDVILFQATDTIAELESQINQLKQALQDTEFTRQRQIRVWLTCSLQELICYHQMF